MTLGIIFTRVNVDSPVGMALPEDEADESESEKEKEKEDEQRQVNMNIVVNVRSPHAEEEGAAAGEKPGQVSAPVPPGDEVEGENSEMPTPPP